MTGEKELSRRKLLALIAAAGAAFFGTDRLLDGVKTRNFEKGLEQEQKEKARFIRETLKKTMRPEFLGKLHFQAKDDKGKPVFFSLLQALAAEVPPPHTENNQGISANIVVLAEEPLTSIYGLSSDIPIHARLDIGYNSKQEHLPIGLKPNSGYNLNVGQLAYTAVTVFKPEFLPHVQVTQEQGILLRLPRRS